MGRMLVVLFSKASLRSTVYSSLKSVSFTGALKAIFSSVLLISMVVTSAFFLMTDD